MTESIKYTGSKLKLLNKIHSLIPKDVKTILDGFSGSTRVSQFLAKQNYKIHSNDISEWSYVLGVAYLQNKENPNYYSNLIQHLNNVNGYHGFFSEHYGGFENDTKKLFQYKNTLKIDAIRVEIDNLNLSLIDKCVVLTSLMLAMDKIDSTMGHFSSYLNKWSKRSYNDIELKIPNLFVNTNDNIITKQDVKEIKDYYDLVYLDPPYGSNNIKMPASRVRYSAYYHIWKTLILNDNPKLFGKVNRRYDSKDLLSYNPYEDFRKVNGEFIATKTLTELLNGLNCKYCLLSYSSDGRTNIKTFINQINYNVLEVIEINYKKNVMANMTWTNQWSNNNNCYEYLFLLEKPTY